jgi:hypothetical protein
VGNSPTNKSDASGLYDAMSGAQYGSGSGQAAGGASAIGPSSQTSSVPTGTGKVNRWIHGWLFFHGYISVTNYDENGNSIGNVNLHWSPDGFTVDNYSYFYSTTTHESEHTKESNRELIRFWKQMEKERKEGKRESYPSVPTPSNNCWTPVFRHYDHGGGRLKSPPNASSQDPFGYWSFQ